MPKSETPPPELSDELLLKAVGALRAAPPMADEASVEPLRALRVNPVASSRGEGWAQAQDADREDSERLMLQAIHALRAGPAQAPPQAPRRRAPSRVVVGGLLLAAGLLLALAAGWGLRVSQRAAPQEGLVDELAPPTPDAAPPQPAPSRDEGAAPRIEGEPPPHPAPPVTPPSSTPPGPETEEPPSPVPPRGDGVEVTPPAPDPTPDDDAPALALVDDPPPSLGYRDRGGEALPIFQMALYTPSGPTPTRVLGQPLNVGDTIHFFASALRATDAQLTVIYPDGRQVPLSVRVSAQPGYLSDAKGRALRFIFPQPGLYRIQLATEGICGEGCAATEVNIQ
jgi:hypothetical protein